MILDLALHIDYKATLSPETVRSLLEAVRVAVNENWKMAGDARDPASFGLNFDETAQPAQDTVQKLAEAKRNKPSGSFYMMFRVAFSPRAPITLCLRIRHYENDTLGVILCLDAETPMRIPGTLSFDSTEPRWLADLARWGKVALVPGVAYEPSMLMEMSPEKRAAWWEHYEQLPQTESLWKTYEPELARIVNTLVTALPIEANQELDVYLECIPADASDLVRRHERNPFCDCRTLVNVVANTAWFLA